MGLRASTLHRLLGWRPGSHSRFAHDRANRLPHDVVIVDETSMVSLWLMARLVEAVRAEARLVLVGDPGQLTSIEAGVVLGDIVSAAAAAERIRGQMGESELGLVRERAVAAGRAVTVAAREGAGHEALEALGRFRLLCAHRRGPFGVSDWTSRVQAWLAAEIPDLDLEQRDYVGRPLLVTENDYELGLYNGDTGVIVQDRDGHATAAFERGSELLRFSPLRLGAVESVYAMTIHKSQGSQFDTAAVLLPAAGSRLLTRELLYTAVTRARRELILVGTEESVRSAVERPVARASGLAERLR
jgi:exodeoxyribonuclease V alpha subunit